MVHLNLLRRYVYVVSSLLLLAFGTHTSAGSQSISVIVTAYSSTVDQTDSTPFLTSTQERVRPGIVAVSRDLLSTELPYGTQIRIIHIEEDPYRCGAWNVDTILEVQDTMHRRKRNQVDIWVPSRAEAIQWGRCQAVLQVI